MKTNKFAQLVKRGLSVKSLMTLTESEINTLHKLYEEKDVCKKCGKKKCICEKKKEESKEQTNVKALNQLPRKTSTTTEYTLQPNDETMVDNMVVKAGDAPTTIKKIGEEEIGESKKKQTKKNPWAICHSQLGPKKTAKFERCVKEVKKQMEENKLPFDKILENKILSLVEKHIKPTMKKGDLMNLIGKKKMNLPIGKLSSIGLKEDEEVKTKPKPKEKPGEKTTPNKKPHDPFKPKPGHKPAPKAKKEETKEAFMDAPVKEPTTRPTTKPTEKPSRPFSPFSPKPSQRPAPKAKKSKLPSWLTFNSLGIKFK